MNYYCPICKKLAIWEVDNLKKPLIRKENLKYYIDDELLRYGAFFENYPRKFVAVGRTEKEFINNIKEILEIDNFYNDSIKVMPLQNLYNLYSSKNKKDLIDYIISKLPLFKVLNCFCKIS